MVRNVITNYSWSNMINKSRIRINVINDAVTCFGNTSWFVYKLYTTHALNVINVISYTKHFINFIVVYVKVSQNDIFLTALERFKYVYEGLFKTFKISRWVPINTSY